MATPHVAGAAAILAGQHPDWTGEQIKSALIGSAKRLPGIGTLAQGSGRLDIARGVAQQVRADGVAGFGAIWGKQDVTRKITYINSGTRPVTLALTLDVNRRDLFTVDRTVTVPGSSSATVTLTAHASAQPAGDVTGVLRAQAGDVVLTTPLTAQFNGDKHKLTVRVPPRAGDPYYALIIAQNEQTGLAEAVFSDTATAELTLPAGRYRVLGRVIDSTFTETFFALPTDVSKDTELAVDTKQGKKISVSLDDPAARPQSGGGMGVMSDVDDSGPRPATGILRAGGVPSAEFPAYSIGGPPMRGLSFLSFSYWTYPIALTTVNGEGGYEFRDSYVPYDLGFTGRLTGRVVDVGEADRESIDRAGDVKDAIAMIVPHNWAEPGYPPGQQLLDGIALLKERGARAVLSFFNPITDNPDDRPTLPTILAFYESDLHGLQDLMKQRPVEVTVDARANSPVSYFLADKVDGAMPAGHDFRFTRASLGRIDRRLVDTMPPGTYRYGVGQWALDGITAGADIEAKWPQQRTDYVSAGASLLLFNVAGFGQTDFGYETTLPVTLKPGERRTSRLFAAPFGPELTTPPTSRQDGKPVPAAYREGDKITLSVPMFADGDPANAGQFDPSNLGSTVLLKDGREIARRDDRPALGTFDVPRGPGRYTLIADANRDPGNLTPALSTRTHAEWTFRAEAGTAQRAALPLLDIRYDLPLDDHNTAHGAVVGKVSAACQPGARASWVHSLGVEVSYDEGKTWQRAKVTGNRLDIPAGQGAFASLRATATDLEGNRVTETVIRAYAIT
jgi:hypothetical protein